MTVFRSPSFRSERDAAATLLDELWTSVLNEGIPRKIDAVDKRSNSFSLIRKQTELATPSDEAKFLRTVTRTRDTPSKPGRLVCVVQNRYWRARFEIDLNVSAGVAPEMHAIKFEAMGRRGPYPSIADFEAALRQELA